MLLIRDFSVSVLCVTWVLWLGFVADIFVLVAHMKLWFGFLFDACDR